MPGATRTPLRGLRGFVDAHLQYRQRARGWAGDPRGPARPRRHRGRAGRRRERARRRRQPACLSRSRSSRSDAMASRSAFVSAFSRAALLGRASTRSPPCWSARSGGSGRRGRQGGRRLEVLVKQPVDEGKPTQTRAPAAAANPDQCHVSLGRQFDSNSHAVHRQRVSRPVVKERDVASLNVCRGPTRAGKSLARSGPWLDRLTAPTDQTIDCRSGPTSRRSHADARRPESVCPAEAPQPVHDIFALASGDARDLGNRERRCSSEVELGTSASSKA